MQFFNILAWVDIAVFVLMLIAALVVNYRHPNAEATPRGWLWITTIISIVWLVAQ